MERIKFEHLDLPIIRSCNLACVGCITHSNHKKIKGLVGVDESREWMQFWSEKLDPNIVGLFGGEPLLHPEFARWAEMTREVWGPRPGISVNTNGYYIDRMFDHIPTLFDEDRVGLNTIVSIQTGVEPYLSKVRENVELLKQRVVEYHLSRPRVKTAEWRLWLDEYENNTKIWYILNVNGRDTRMVLATCEQYRLPWCTHYSGFAEEMTPVYDYTDKWYEHSHKQCQAKEFVTLYRGTLWKCPPMGVLEHTLNTFNIADKNYWQPFLQDYKTVGPTSTDSEIAAWFERQRSPERVCNMCGFSGPKNVMLPAENRSHMLKDYWNYTL